MARLGRRLAAVLGAGVLGSTSRGKRGLDPDAVGNGTVGALAAVGAGLDGAVTSLKGFGAALLATVGVGCVDDEATGCGSGWLILSTRLRSLARPVDVVDTVRLTTLLGPGAVVGAFLGVLRVSGMAGAVLG